VLKTLINHIDTSKGSSSQPTSISYMDKKVKTCKKR